MDNNDERFFTASEGRPVTDKQKEQTAELKAAVAELADLIEAYVPVGRNRSLALTHLEDVLMRSNRGIYAPDGHK